MAHPNKSISSSMTLTNLAEKAKLNMKFQEMILNLEIQTKKRENVDPRMM